MFGASSEESIPDRLLEQRLLPAPVRPRTLHAKVLIRQMCSHSSARRAVQKSDLDEERLIDFLDGVSLLRQRRCQRVHPHWPALVLLDDAEQQLAVNLVEAVAIDLEHLQRRLRRRFVDLAYALHLGVVTYPAQQPVGNARCAPAA